MKKLEMLDGGVVVIMKKHFENVNIDLFVLIESNLFMCSINYYIIESMIFLSSVNMIY